MIKLLSYLMNLVNQVILLIVNLWPIPVFLSRNKNKLFVQEFKALQSPSFSILLHKCVNDNNYGFVDRRSLFHLFVSYCYCFLFN